MTRNTLEQSVETLRAFLREHRWLESTERSPWSWREPRTGAWYTLGDAVALERSRK